jgi:hypothetical protein
MVLSITKATPGGSEDVWGDITNTALDDIVSEVNNNADGTNATTPNMTSLQIGGVAMTSTAAELNILDGASVTTAEINILDGDTSATSTTVVDADRVVFNDDGTMKQVAVSDLKTYINASAGSGSVTSVGLDAPTGLTVSGSPVTTSGTLALTFTSGYSIPTTSSQSNWNTAYGWGDHSTQGYLTSVSSTTVGNATASLAAGAKGSYALLWATGTTLYEAGDTLSGSSLRFANALADWNEPNEYGVAPTSTIAAPSGTWRCMGNVGYYDGTSSGTDTRAFARTTVWLRSA